MKMFLKVSLALLLAASVSEAGVSMHDPFYCFATDPIRPQNTMFSIFTGYEAARGREIPVVSSCRARKFFMFTRGGTRLPNGGDMRRMIEIHDRLQTGVLRNFNNGRTTLCRDDQRHIEEWIFNTTMIDTERNSTLHLTGWREMGGIAERFQRLFPDILPRTYSRSDFLFKATNERTQESLLAFAEALFGHTNIVFEENQNPDLLLRPQDNCPLFQQIRGNLVEQRAFENGAEFQQMLEQVNRKLGFTGSNQYNSRDIRTIWDFCAFYQGWDPESPSPWCSAFSIANLAVIEYFRDLDSYNNFGYGGNERLLSNLNCHMMQDLIRFFQSTDPNDHLARVYSTHSPVLMMFFVTLDVFRDPAHLTRHNFAQQAFRHWRTSMISPMASNFVFIQHLCDDGDHDIQILFNERPLWVPGCEQPGLCKQSTFLRIFERFVNANCAQLFCSEN